MVPVKAYYVPGKSNNTYYSKMNFIGGSGF